MTTAEVVAELKDILNQVYYDEEKVALAAAIESLEKQVLKKPVQTGGCYRCPSCNEWLSWIENESYDIDKFCAECGQKLDWDPIRKDRNGEKL